MSMGKPYNAEWVKAIMKRTRLRYNFLKYRCEEKENYSCREWKNTIEKP